jgi:hypothetical protein
MGKKGGNAAGQRAAAQQTASEQAAQVKPDGLYFTLKSSVDRKSSDDTEDESSPGDSSSPSPDADVATAKVEGEAAAPATEAGLPVMTGRLYTARGALTPPPSLAGGVFEATV